MAFSFGIVTFVTSGTISPVASGFVKSTLIGSLLMAPNFLGVFFFGFNLKSPSCLTGSSVFVCVDII